MSNRRKMQSGECAPAKLVWKSAVIGKQWFENFTLVSKSYLRAVTKTLIAFQWIVAISNPIFFQIGLDFSFKSEQVRFRFTSNCFWQKMETKNVELWPGLLKYGESCIHSDGDHCMLKGRACSLNGSRMTLHRLLHTGWTFSYKSKWKYSESIGALIKKQPNLVCAEVQPLIFVHLRVRWYIRAFSM